MVLWVPKPTLQQTKRIFNRVETKLRVTTALYKIDTGCYNIKLFLFVNLLPVAVFGSLCLDILIHSLWKHFIQFGSCFFIITYFVIMLAQWLFLKFDAYGYIFYLIKFVMNIFPYINYGGNILQSWGHYMHTDNMGPSQNCYQRIFAPNCTSRRHAHMHKKYCYLQHHTNTFHGRWHRNTRNYLSDDSDDDR